MEGTINYGIDLGTTNSAIAKFIKGDVKVFKDPNGWKDVIPSVVGFRKDKILIGEQAKTYLEREPNNVVGLFKRKMGTSESFPIKSLKESKTPVELSSFILKELKTFVNSQEPLDAVVITIPASFDTIQSNATKEAGLMAGFKQVELLQEPIAASLAYANMKKEKEMIDGQWLVYDLGGGTFDVALIRIKNKELKIIDHEGNNFLGGSDFDRLIVEKIIIPKLEEKYSFENLRQRMQDSKLDIKMNGKYHSLLHTAEVVKKHLSNNTSADLTVEYITDDEGEDVDIEITITRSEFNELIKPMVDETINLIKNIITRNSLKPSDLEYTLMVGGSTYIPYVRSRVEEILSVPINIEIDPTTAVAIGAAYYAATIPKDLSTEQSKNKNYKISIRAAYQKTSIEKEELFAARVSGNLEGLFYRITREDGGFNSGLKKLTEKISEDLPLVNDVYNFFKLAVYDAENNIIETNIDAIGINSSIGGDVIQPLPEDICLEVDDYDNPEETKLQLLFEKGRGLPSKLTLTKTLNKDVFKGSSEDIIRIKVLEGTHTAMPSANKLIGYLEIKGTQLVRDVIKGSDIDLSFKMSTSRDFSVSAYLKMSDQEFKDVFKGQLRTTNVEFLQEEINLLSEKLDDEFEHAKEKEDYLTAKAIKELKEEMEEIREEANALTTNDSTDRRYWLEDKKIKIAQGIDAATKHKRIELANERYYNKKLECDELISESGNDYERKTFDNIVANEQAFLATNSPLKIYEKIDELSRIISQINWRTPAFLKEIFKRLKDEFPKMNDTSTAKSLIDAGKVAIENENWDRLREIDYDLIDQLSDAGKRQMVTYIGIY